MSIQNPETLSIEFGVNHATITHENGERVFIMQDPAWGNYTARRESNGNAVGHNFLTILQAVNYVLAIAVDESDNEFTSKHYTEPSPFEVIMEGYSDGDNLALRMVQDAFPEGTIERR